MLKKIGYVFVSILIFVSFSLAQNATYIGVKKCKMCHTKDNVYKVWEKTKHAIAFKTLSGDQAKKLDKGKNASLDAKCVACHVASSATKATYDDGVACESCHGPGSEHMKLIMKDKEKGKAALKAIKAGDSKVCEKCHNKQSPTFKGFDYNKDWKLIVHTRKS
jgi:hypothetical protein